MGQHRVFGTLDTALAYIFSAQAIYSQQEEGDPNNVLLLLVFHKFLKLLLEW